MRVWVGLAMAGLAGIACAPRPQSPAVPTPPPTLPSPAASPAATPTPAPPAPEGSAHDGGVPDFARDVQPILARACDPCHFPGGKMYQPMPFDDPKTVASHKEGVLRRLKGSDRTAAERWFAAAP